MSRPRLQPRSSYRHWQSIGTRWHDNDIYGHVNNTVYYSWFDTTVNSWLIDAGLLAIEGSDPIGLVAETRCRYARSVSFPDRIEIGLAVERIGSSSVAYRLGVFACAVEGAAAEGQFTHVYVDRATRRPTPVPLSWRPIFERLT